MESKLFFCLGILISISSRVSGDPEANPDPYADPDPDADPDPGADPGISISQIVMKKKDDLCEHYKGGLKNYDIEDGWAGKWFLMAYGPPIKGFSRMDCGVLNQNTAEDADAHITMAALEIRPSLTCDKPVNIECNYNHGKIYYVKPENHVEPLDGSSYYILDGEPDKFQIVYTCKKTKDKKQLKQVYLYTRSSVRNGTLMDSMYQTVKTKVKVSKGQFWEPSHMDCP